MNSVLKFVAVSCMAVVMCVSCAQKRYFAFDEIRRVTAFPVSYEPCAPEVIDLGVIGVRGIKVLEDRMLVSCHSEHGCLFMFTKTGTMMSDAFLNAGNGPGEILYSPFMSWVGFDGSGLYVYDFKGNFLEYDMLESSDTGIPAWRSLAEGLPMGEGARYFYLDSDRLLCRKSRAGGRGYERFVIDMNGNVLDTPNVGALNAICSSEMNLLSTGFAVNGDLNRVAELGSRQSVVHVYSVEDDFAVTLAVGGRMSELAELEQLSQEEMQKAYYDSKTFDDFFAALYLGATIDELDSDTFDNPRIHLFDWDGNPVAEIKVPVRALYFDIDIVGKNLYVVEYESEHLLKYDISDLFDRLG